jgi:preprotein translocase subunit SecA
MESDDISGIIKVIREDVINEVITKYIPPKTMEEQWDITGLEAHLQDEFEVEIPVAQMLKDDTSLHEESIVSPMGAQLLRLLPYPVFSLNRRLYRKQKCALDHLLMTNKSE